MFFFSFFFLRLLFVVEHTREPIVPPSSLHRQGTKRGEQAACCRAVDGSSPALGGRTGAALCLPAVGRADAQLPIPIPPRSDNTRPAPYPRTARRRETRGDECALLLVRAAGTLPPDWTRAAAANGAAATRMQTGSGRRSEGEFVGACFRSRISLMHGRCTALRWLAADVQEGCCR